MDFTQAVTTTPVFNPNTLSPVFSATATSATTRATRDLADNPLGGSGSWRWNQPASTGCVGILSNTVASFNDGEYSIGIWFKISALPGGTTIYPLFGVQPRATSASSLLISIRGSGATSPGTFSVTQTGRVSNTGVSVPIGSWNYLALVKRTDGSGNFYLNGASVFIPGSLGSTGTTQVNIGPVATTNGTTPFDLSFTDFYISNPGQIDATQISEIWTAGSTAPVTSFPLKYWDGTQWATPLNKQQWNGSAWVPMNGKVWNGSVWMPIS